MRRLLPRGECTPGRTSGDFDCRVGQYPHLMATPDKVGGDAEGGRNGAAAVDDGQEEAAPVPNVGPDRVFAHVTMLASCCDSCHAGRSLGRGRTGTG